MKNSGLGQWLAVASLPAIVCLFLVTAIMHFRFTPDTTFIYAQFAKNILHGNGISFNAGEQTFGFTSPLWLLLMTMAGKAGLDLIFIAKALDLAVAGIAVSIFYLLANEIIRDQPLALLCTLVCSLNAWFIGWTGTGMETSLALLCVMSALLLTLRNRYLWAVIVTSAGILVRPELFFLLPLILMDVLINATDYRQGLILSVRLVGVSMIVLVPWSVYACHTFGSILPDAVLSNVGFHFTVDRFFSITANVVRTIAISDGTALLVLIGSAVFLLLRSRHQDDEEGFSPVQKFIIFRQSLVGLGWVVTIPVVYVIAGVGYTPGYLIVILPMISVYAFWYLERSLTFSGRSRFRYTGILIITALMMLQSQIVYRYHILPDIIETETGRESAAISIGRWLHDQTLSKDIIFGQDAGALAYYSDRKICDVSGDLPGTATSFVGQADTFGKLIEAKLYKGFCNATYLVDRSDVKERWKNYPDLIPQFTTTFYRTGVGDLTPGYYTVYKIVQPLR